MDSRVMVSCASCGRKAGPFASYQEFEDSLRADGWEVGEELILCPACSGRS